MRNWPSDSPCKDDKAGFTMVPLKALLDRVGIRNECLRSLKKIIFNCFFLQNGDGLVQATVECTV